MESSAKFRGGLSNRRVNITWPFATLVVTADRVTLRSPLGGAEIAAGSRWHLQRWSGLIAQGVRFTDNRSLYAVTVWTYRLPEVVRVLEEHGWHVGNFPERDSR